MNKKSIDRFYDIASDFNDSLALISIMLIMNKKTEICFIELKRQLCDLECDDETIDAIEEMALMTSSADMGRLIRLLSPIDGLFVREKPRDIPSTITEGRKRNKNKKPALKKKRKQVARTKKIVFTKAVPTLF